MSQAQKPIFLGKRGAITGPISVKELENLKLSGKIDDFTYIWDWETTAWRALDPLPPPPKGLTLVSTELLPWTGIEAICHNFSQVISGNIANVSDFGCDLITKDSSDSPRLGLQSNLVLNVIDPKKDRAMNVPASLSDVTRKDGLWIYHLRWTAIPSF